MTPDDLGSLEALQNLDPRECTERQRALYIAVAIRLGEDNPQDRAQVLAETRRWFERLDWSEQPMIYMSSYLECSRDGNTAWMAYSQEHPLDHDRLLLMKHLNEQCSEMTHVLQWTQEKMRRSSTTTFPLDEFIQEWDARNNTTHLSSFKTALSSMYPLDQMTRHSDRDVRIQHAKQVFHMLTHAMASWKQPVHTFALPPSFSDVPA